MFDELEVQADAESQLAEGGIRLGGLATTETAGIELTAGLSAGVLLDGVLAGQFVRVEWLDMHFFELFEVVNIQLLLCVLLLEGVKYPPG